MSKVQGNIVNTPNQSPGGDIATSARTNSLEDELLQLIARQSKRVPIAAFLAALVIAYFIADHVSNLLAGIWLAIVGLVLTLRFVVLPRLPTLTQLSHTKRIQIATGLSFLNGLVFAASLLAFNHLPELERAIHSVILVALSTGAVATTAGYKPLFLSYMLPAFIGMVPLWIFSPGLPTAGFKEVALGLLILMFGAILTGLALDAWRVFKESFNIRSEVLKLNEKLSNALRDAEAANNAKTRFLASASHDLRQPIHTLSLFGAALSMRQLDGQTREIADHLNLALQNLATQLDSLLDISKLDAGVMDKNLTVVNLSNMILNLEEEYRRVCEQKNLQLKCGLSAGLPSIETDASLLERILRNLISNAIKYTDEGTIYLSCNREQGHLVIRISDTGRGISTHEQRNIFEEFYQVDNPERDRSKGLGLGLSIVKRLTDMLNIKLEMESTFGKGSEFKLLIPKNIEIENQIQLTPQDDCIARPANADRILVIDDEKLVRAGMKTLLTTMGYTVDLCESTREAVELARKNPPCLILADLRLRGMDNGIDSIHAIREFLPGVPAVLISGDTAPNRLKGAQLAGIKMLHKPVDINELRNCILTMGSEGTMTTHPEDVRASA